MQVKILQDFQYSFDGIHPTSFTEGEVTNKFTDKVAKLLMERKWVGVKGSKTISEKSNAGPKSDAKAKKFEERKSEIMALGAKHEEGFFYHLAEKFSDADLLALTNEEWSDYLESLSPDSDKGSIDDSFDEDDEDDEDGELEKVSEKASEKDKTNKKNK